MIRETVDRLVADLGDLTAEQEVHAATARRLAGLMDDGDAPGYAMPAIGRELRASVAALMGAPKAGQGVGLDDLDALLPVGRFR